MTEPLCVAYQAVVNNSRVDPGDVVVVIGPGPIGLLSAKMASLAGASEIIAVGTEGDDGRLRLALECGATVAINSSREDVLKQIMSLHDGYGADLVVDTAGASATLKLSLDAVRPGGQITKIGWGPEPGRLQPRSADRQGGHAQRQFQPHLERLGNLPHD